MSDGVSLRPKSPSLKTRLDRVPSRRSQFLSRFFDQKSDARDRRVSKEQLIERGIYRPEAVFGNDLCNLPLNEKEKVPVFVVDCITRIEKMITTVGIYRINGDAATVQKIRLEIDHENYQVLETNDVSLLASTLKLFFRELPEPLITREVRNELFDNAEEKDMAILIKSIRKSIERLPSLTLTTLKFLLRHLKRVADEPENKMGVKNLATVFSPSMVHCVTQKRRPESLINEMELTNIIVEHLIEYVDKIFG